MKKRLVVLLSAVILLLTSCGNSLPADKDPATSFFIDLIDGNLLISPRKCL